MSAEHSAAGQPRKRGIESLDVWWRARALVVLVYDQVAALPLRERYGLSDQLRRAAVSVLANIAEGHGRIGRAEFRHGVSIALGSLAEVKSLLLVCTDVKLRTEDDIAPALAEAERVGQMLTRLAAALKG